MKHLKIFLLLGLVFIGSCKKDDPPIIINSLNYDGSNSDAPLFDPGLHEASARFNSSYLQDYQGRFIEAVEFYIQDRPDLCEIVIYAGGDLSGPDSLLYEFDVSNNVDANSWNEHVLTDPIEITGEDLWITVAVSANTPKKMIGCDAGPTIFNGDLLYTEFDEDWISFFNRTNQTVSINWNIRAVLIE